MIEKISSILKSKGPSIHAVSPDVPVHEAVRMMAQKGIAAVLVIEQGNLLGVVSAKDYGARVVLKGRNGRDVPVREAMTSPVLTVKPEANILEAMDIMTTNKIRHLPVMENGKLTGVVTLGDLARAILADKEHTIEQLMRYVGQK